MYQLLLSTRNERGPVHTFIYALTVRDFIIHVYPLFALLFIYSFNDYLIIKGNKANRFLFFVTFKIRFIDVKEFLLVEKTVLLFCYLPTALN